MEKHPGEERKIIKPYIADESLEQDIAAALLGLEKTEVRFACGDSCF